MSSCVLVSEWLLTKVVLTADFTREETSMNHATGCLTETAVCYYLNSCLMKVVDEFCW